MWAPSSPLQRALCRVNGSVCDVQFQFGCVKLRSARADDELRRRKED